MIIVFPVRHEIENKPATSEIRYTRYAIRDTNKDRRVSDIFLKYARLIQFRFV